MRTDCTFKKKVLYNLYSRIAERACSRKVGFRHTKFSETNFRQCRFSETRLRVIRVSMDDLSLPEVRRLVAAANAVRWRRDASGSAAGSDARRAERRLDDLFGTGHTLATYGTLVPGGSNHHVVAPLGGEWTA